MLETDVTKQEWTDIIHAHSLNNLKTPKVGLISLQPYPYFFTRNYPVDGKLLSYLVKPQKSYKHKQIWGPLHGLTHADWYL